jgi:hypothetical protein
VKTTVLVFGVVIALLGLLGAFRPKPLRAFVGSFRSIGMLYFAATIRIALGIVLLLAAPTCRFTIALYMLGVVTLFSGLLLPMLGKVRFAALIGWWLSLSDGSIRATMVLAILLGTFLILAAS